MSECAHCVSQIMDLCLNVYYFYIRFNRKISNGRINSSNPNYHQHHYGGGGGNLGGFSNGGGYSINTSPANNNSNGPSLRRPPLLANAPALAPAGIVRQPRGPDDQAGGFMFRR